MSNIILGVHVKKVSCVLDKKTSAKSMSQAIIRDVGALPINAIQVFTFGPRNVIPNKIDYEEIIQCTKNLDVTVHSAYPTTNLWTITQENKTTASSSNKLTAFKAQLASCKKIGAWGVVLHVTKEYPDDVTKTMSVLKPLAKKIGVKIILEMVALKADADRTYETPEKIDNLTTMLGPNETYWGWCIDTAHIWAAGVDVRKYESVKTWLDTLTYKKKIVQFHLNGSSKNLGSGKDTHEAPFSPYDQIWNGIKPEESGVRAIVEFALKHNITIICEINRGAESDIRKSLNTIIKLSKKE